MSKRIIVIDITGRQSEDMEEALWAVKNVVSHVGGFNEAFDVGISDENFEKLANDFTYQPLEKDES